MIDNRLLNEIDKIMNLVIKRITNGRIIVDKINDGKKLFINIENGDYEIKEFNIDIASNYTDVLIIGEVENTIEDIRNAVEKKKYIIDNGGLLIIKHIIFDEEHMDSVKEEILKLLKNNEVEEVKVCFVYSKTELSNKTLSIMVMGRKQLDLLKDSLEYEEYSSNKVSDKKCGGCSSKKQGCSSGGCDGKSCCKNKK